MMRDYGKNPYEITCLYQKGVRNNMGKKWIAAILTFSFLFTACLFMVSADGDIQENEKYANAIINGELKVSAKSAVLMEAGTGKILYAFNENERRPPASVTKIMTLLLVMEAVDNGQIKLEDKVACSQNASKMGGSQIWLKEGEEMSVHELLKAVAVYSANDAACLLGEYVAGSEDAFIALMNDRAARLGMKDTVFKNTNGLPEEGHFTSAYDIALMSKELLAHEKILEYTTIWMDSLRDGKTELVNTNKLIRFYKGCNGLKTGFTDEAGYCISATAKREDMQLIAVLMGSATIPERNAAASAMLDYGFANWSVIQTKQPENLPEIKVKKGTEEKFVPECGIAPQILIEKAAGTELETKIEVPAELAAPVQKGQTVGEVTYWRKGQKVAALPLRAPAEIPRMTFMIQFQRLLADFLNVC